MHADAKKVTVTPEDTAWFRPRPGIRIALGRLWGLMLLSGGTTPVSNGTDPSPLRADRVRVVTWNLWWRYGAWRERRDAIIDELLRVKPTYAGCRRSGAIEVRTSQPRSPTSWACTWSTLHHQHPGSGNERSAIRALGLATQC